MKTRFSKFYNLPELMNSFKETADIKTADMLHLDTPEAVYHNVAIKPSDFQKEIVSSLADRAKDVRDSNVEPTVDNMLKITNDGRKLALDQRLINPTLPDDEASKTAVCAKNVYDIWEKTKDEQLSQLVFCDLSTPTSDGFNVYDDLKSKLTEKGIPDEEIAFIHSAKTEKAKAELFSKVRNGKIRILIGSTAKMGAGTNVQKKLVALHHLDCPWRPSDLQQREGRIIRQGNDNKKVDIFSYVTENTFDAYLYQLVENKQKFISQIMTSKSPVRAAEDIDEQALSYAEVKALATGNPHIKEKMDLDIQVTKLRLLKSNYQKEQFNLQDKILKDFPWQINTSKNMISGFEKDMDFIKGNTIPNEDGFSPMILLNKKYTDKKSAGEALLAICKVANSKDETTIGEYRGMPMTLSFNKSEMCFVVKLKHELTYTVNLGEDTFGNIQRIDNMLDSIPKRFDEEKENLLSIEQNLENAKLNLNKPFEKLQELEDKVARLNELTALLSMDDDNTPINEQKQEEQSISVEDIDTAVISRNYSAESYAQEQENEY